MSRYTMIGGGLAALLFLFCSASVLQADDPTGTWKWDYKNTEGKQVQITLKLKLEADNTLTGTLRSPVYEEPIKDGVYRDGDISFQVVNEYSDHKIVQTYDGKHQGDTIKGTIKLDFGTNARTYPWNAKREQP